MKRVLGLYKQDNGRY